jgi:dTDP-4-amino-4,6-dideoxygalactose transaminase
MQKLLRDRWIWKCIQSYRGLCMSNRVIPPVKLYFPAEDIAAIKVEVEKILQSGMLTLGEYTKNFETEYAKMCRTRYAVAVNSGTGALEVALRSVGLRAGDEVLVPTNTFTATVAAVVFAGGKPVFTDIDPESLCITAEEVRRRLTPKTRGVIVVHIGGLVCPDIFEIKKICEDEGFFLIEDAAHAHGSLIDGKPAGSLGDAGCFSFYPTKVMTTGEGGMVTTDSEEIAEKALILRDQGKENFNSNIIVELGYNWRMDEISAAIGLVQIKRLPEIIRKRNNVARLYDEKLSNIKGIKAQRVPKNILHNYYKYTVFLDRVIDRDGFKQKLRELGVRCGGEVYWPPCHLQPVYQRLLGVKPGDFPLSEDATRRKVCLPMYAQMTYDDVNYVVEKVNYVLSN